MPADETQFLATKYVGAFPPVGYGPNLVQVIGHCDVEVCLVLKKCRSHTPSVGRNPSTALAKLGMSI